MLWLYFGARLAFQYRDVRKKREYYWTIRIMTTRARSSGRGLPLFVLPSASGALFSLTAKAFISPSIYLFSLYYKVSTL